MNKENELIEKITMVLKRAVRENNPDWTDKMTNKLIERATSLLISKDPSCDRYGIVPHDAVIKLNSSSLEDITNWTSEQIVDFVDPIFMKALTLLAYEASYVSAIQPVIESAQPVIDHIAPYNSMLYGISTGLSAALVFFSMGKTVPIPDLVDIPKALADLVGGVAGQIWSAKTIIFFAMGSAAIFNELRILVYPKKSTKTKEDSTKDSSDDDSSGIDF